MKEKLQFIVISFFMWLLFSTINVLANSYQYDSSDVQYDNTGSSLESTDVQGAVSELYQAATDYSSLDNRVINLETHFKNNASGYFTKNSLYVVGEDENLPYLNFVYNNKGRGTITASDSGFTVGSRDADGTWAKGILNLRGDTINVNGGEVNIGNSTSVVKIKGKPIDGGLYVNGMSSIANSSISLRNATGSIRSNNLSYKISGDTMIITGRLELNITTRTGSNPGASITIPGSRLVDGSADIHISTSSYVDGPRYGESTLLKMNDGASIIMLGASETHINVSDGKTLILYVPMIFIKLK